MLRLVTEGCEGLIAGQRLLVQALSFLCQPNRACLKDVHEMELLRRIFEQDQVVYAALEAYAEDQVDQDHDLLFVKTFTK